VRAVIADDSVLVPVSLLRDDTGIDVAAQLSNAEELLREADDHRPDVVSGGAHAMFAMDDERASPLACS
jgi:DNA-binding NarL/FixJ family response regulator